MEYATVVSRTTGSLESLDTIVAAALRGELDEPRVRQLHARGTESVTFVLITKARRLAEQDRRSF